MVLSVNEARQSLSEAVGCCVSQESVPLEAALGRIAAEDTFAQLEVPPADNSAMDGYAVNTADITTVPCSLPVSQRIPAGAVPQPLSAGTAARIFTGAALPQGANAVVIQEHCETEGNAVLINHKVSVGDNIRPAGQDIKLGDRVVSVGQRLSPVDLGLLASVGLAETIVFKKLKVALFSTGDELALPGETLRPGQIYNSNRAMLQALCHQAGFETLDCGLVEDTLEATERALMAAASKADVIISTGGVSVGEEDHIRPALEALGKVQAWKVQMKPGKPVVVGDIAETPFIGLPGNPVSAFVVFDVIAMPVLQKLQGATASHFETIDVASGFTKNAGTREEFIRVRLNRESGRTVAESFNNQSSGVLFSLAWADGLVRQKVGQSIQPGDRLDFLPLKGGLL